jgi:hypothetical protein
MPCPECLICGQPTRPDSSATWQSIQMTSNGEDNKVADTLSRQPPSVATSVKEPSRPLAAVWQGGKPESATPFESETQEPQ